VDGRDGQSRILGCFQRPGRKLIAGRSLTAFTTIWIVSLSVSAPPLPYEPWSSTGQGQAVAAVEIRSGLVHQASAHGRIESGLCGGEFQQRGSIGAAIE
jgi:hypothetical protein